MAESLRHRVAKFLDKTVQYDDFSGYNIPDSEEDIDPETQKYVDFLYDKADELIKMIRKGYRKEYRWKDCKCKEEFDKNTGASICCKCFGIDLRGM